MALSASRDYIQTRDDLITLALTRSRTISPGETASVGRVTNAANELNLILNTWATDGVFVHAKSEEVLPLTADTGSYTLDADILEVENVFFRQGDTDVELFPMTRENYSQLPNKLESGSPIHYYVDRQLAAPKLHLWPLVDTATGFVTGSDAADYICKLDHTSVDADTLPTTGTDYADYWEAITTNVSSNVHVDDTDYISDRVHFTKTQRLQDFDTSTDNPDLPTKYYGALVDALTLTLAEINDLEETTMRRLEFKAEKSLEKAFDDSTDRDSLTIAPEV